MATRMTTGELAHKIHVSRVHAWRLAKAGIVPGTKRTKGGHFYFVRCSQLTRWTNFVIGGAFRRKELARAYAKHYGNEKLQQEKEECHLRSEFKKASRRVRGLNFGEYSNHDFFWHFHHSICTVSKILDELIHWREGKLKSELIKLSRKKLSVLRKLIDKWLNDQQSTPP